MSPKDGKSRIKNMFRNLWNQWQQIIKGVWDEFGFKLITFMKTISYTTIILWYLRKIEDFEGINNYLLRAILFVILANILALGLRLIHETIRVGWILIKGGFDPRKKGGPVPPKEPVGFIRNAFSIISVVIVIELLRRVMIGAI